MQIKDGKLYLNRTWKYLYPALRVYGNQPITYLNTLLKQGVGVYDSNYQDGEKHIPKIFILIQTKVLGVKGINVKEYDEKISDFFTFIRQQEYYVDDYLYDIDNKCCSHMVVLKFPEYFNSILGFFKKGEYSSMYKDLKTIKKMFPNNNLKKNVLSHSITVGQSVGENLEIHGVLSKDNIYKQEFVRILNKEFGTSLLYSDLNPDAELDFAPVLQEEIFNFQINI